MCVVVSLTSCLGTRHLQDDEYLLRKQKVKGGKHLDREELDLFFKQEPNKKIPLIPFAPYVWIYHQGLNWYDKEKVQKKMDKITTKFDKKIAKANNKDKPGKVKRLTDRKEKKLNKKKEILKDGNLLMRWGEPLSVYDESLAEQTNEQFDLYMKTQGYFSSKATYQVKKKGKLVYVTYHLKEGAPHLIDSFYVSTTNKNIESIIKSNWEDRLVHSGDKYNQDILAKERARIEKLLQNNGYFDFTKRYISFKIDTLNKFRKADVEMTINPPARGYHKVFTIDSVIFVMDAGVQGAGKRQSSTYNKINYQFYENNYSKKILDQRTFIYPGEVYSRQNTVNTQTQLANLDNFKFVNVNYDTTGNRFISNIFTSSLPKYQMTNELGMNVTQGVPGPFYQFSLKDRNVFKGLENMELSGHFGFEGVASVTGESDVYSSTETGAKFSIYFPHFLLPGFRKLKQNSGLLNPNTVLQTGFDFTSRPEYDRTGFNASLRYNWRNYDKNINHNFTLIDIGLINSDLDKNNKESGLFKQYLDSLKTQGNNLQSSFNPSFVTSTQYLVTYNFNPLNDEDNKASYLKLFGETGGAIYNLYTPEILINNNLEYYQFLKGNVEYIRHVPVSEFGVVASRIRIGAAYPYGKNSSLPYEKYLFAGGSNSVRAWRPRRLGPGSYNHNADTVFNYENKIEQPGELLIEANLEYRNKLVGFIDWAFFIDAGNTWLMRGDNTRPKGQFDFKRFYKEFGIGSGLGLRLNFSFLIVRFDYAVKMYDPIRPEGERFIGDQITLKKLGGEKGQALWNLAIGYPF